MLYNYIYYSCQVKQAMYWHHFGGMEAIHTKIYMHDNVWLTKCQKSARYHIDRANSIVLPQKGATTACFIQEEPSGCSIYLYTNFRRASSTLVTTVTLH
jgi:hypothetical protein